MSMTCVLQLELLGQVSPKPKGPKRQVIVGVSPLERKRSQVAWRNQQPWKRMSVKCGKDSMVMDKIILNTVKCQWRCLTFVENLVLFENATDVTVKMKTVKFTLCPALHIQPRVCLWMDITKVERRKCEKGSGKPLWYMLYSHSWLGRCTSNSGFPVTHETYLRLSWWLAFCAFR